MTTTSKWGGTRAALQRAEDRQAAEAVPVAVPAPAVPAAVPEPGTPEHVEALADAEAAQAARDLAEIEERVIDGDETVTPEHVEKARGLARFAGLRREAAARKAEAQRQREAEERRDAAFAEARRLMDAAPRAAVDEKLTAAQKAVTELREAVHAYNRGAQAAFDVLARTPELPAAHYDPVMPNPVAFGYGYPLGHRALWLDGNNVLSLDVRSFVKRATEER
ncbi:hypothetical protein [Streptomyces subrutilus]|uniref:hypothetical protein n=1 Tax=Streptomyces subrutilus TaxID=36818 RepID=UPI002E141EE0|nr:hypothetical protein OG479_29505 [Streptomyces subrutilus]